MPSATRRTRALGLALLGVVALLAAVAPARLRAQGTDSARVVTSPDSLPNARIVGVLRAGDLLRIHVYRDSELSGEYQIDAQGTVQIPGMGVVRAAGSSPAQVKERLIATLRERGFSNPELAVYPLVRVAVLGEVRTPSLYSVDPGTSLIQLVTLAGGPTERAELRRTRVVRENRAFVVNLESALGGSSSGRVALNSNDVVYVPRRSGFTREMLQVVLTSAALVLSLVTAINTSKP